MLSGEPSKPTSALVAWSILIVAACVVYLSCLGSYMMLGSHEVVAAVPGREMLHSGDWVVPRYGDVPRIRKPPLVYWLVASSGWLFGEFSDFAVRFHSAITALGMVALMSLWATRWYGRTAGFCAAMVQTTSMWAVYYGRHVEIDMVMCLLTTTMMFLIATQPADESASRTRWRWIGILTLIGLTWLAKFHYGAMMIFAPVAVWWGIQRQWRRWLDFVNPIGMLIAIACFAIWPYLMLRECPEALERWRFETIGRATGEIGYDSWWYYGPELLRLTLPWVGHALWAVPQSWQRAWKQGDERERLLWIWLLVDLAIISVTPNKHSNYLLAAMPVMTLLTTQTFARGLASIHRGSVRFPKLAPSACLVAVAMGGIVLNLLAAKKWPAAQTGILWITGVALFGMIVVGWSWQRRRWLVAGWGTLASGMAILLIALNLVAPAFDPRRGIADFSRQLRREVLKGQPVCVFARGGALPEFHPAVFYLDDPVFQVHTLSGLLQRVEQAGQLMAVIEPQTLEQIREGDGQVAVEELARMPLQNEWRENPLVCVRLTNRLEGLQQAAHVDRDDVTATTFASGKRR